MRRLIITLVVFIVSVALGFAGGYGLILARTASPSPTPVVSSTPVPDLTQKSRETLHPLEELLRSQTLTSVWPFNPLKYAIRASVKAGVPANTIVLLLLLPLIATVIAGARHIIGLRGFGIFLPAALSVVFIAIGPVLGIGLFLLIVSVSMLGRMVLRRLKVKMQYLPRMAILLWLVSISVLAVLFLAPVINWPVLSNVSIFAVLVLALLAEDFTRVQSGKSAKTAITLTTETIILSLVSYLFLTLKPIQAFALLNPEVLLVGILVVDLFLGRYVGLRILEVWRFRKLIK